MAAGCVWQADTGSLAIVPSRRFTTIQDARDRFAQPGEVWPLGAMSPIGRVDIRLNARTCRISGNPADEQQIPSGNRPGSVRATGSDVPTREELMTCPFCHYPVEPDDASTTTVSFYICVACGEEWSVRWRGNDGTILLPYAGGRMHLPESDTVRRST